MNTSPFRATSLPIMVKSLSASNLILLWLLVTTKSFLVEMLDALASKEPPAICCPSIIRSVAAFNETFSLDFKEADTSKLFPAKNFPFLKLIPFLICILLLENNSISSMTRSPDTVKSLPA